MFGTQAIPTHTKSKHIFAAETQTKILVGSVEGPCEL